MKLQARAPAGERGARRGAALLMSLLVLFVLVAIVFQINVSTGTGARTARNDVGLTTMDLAIESALLRVFEDLKEDAEADQAASGASGLPGAADGGAEVGGEVGGEVGDSDAEGSGESPEPSDSREDEWAKPQQTSFEEMDVRLRILIQDEDAKFNVLAMVSPDEEEAELALERVTRILDLCREDTDYDIDTGTAERMARAMQEYMLRRDPDLPRPALLSAQPEREELTLPLSLREFAGLEPFEPGHFRDFRDKEDTVVHSIGAYLTVWSSLATSSTQSAATDPDAAGAGPVEEGGEEEEGKPADEQEPDEGNPAQTPPAGASAGGDLSGAENLTGGVAGFAVNINTAPPAVLKGLFDDRDLDPRFWDEVIRYRNTEVEDDEQDPDAEPVFDEFGEEVLRYQFFDSPSKLTELDEWSDIEGAVRQKLNELVLTKSQVFSIYVTAVRKTGRDEGGLDEDPNNVASFENRAGDQLVRTVRCVVWRRDADESVEIVPVVRWEVLDYFPFEVLDDPTERRE